MQGDVTARSLHLHLHAQYALRRLRIQDYPCSCFRRTYGEPLRDTENSNRVPPCRRALIFFPQPCCSLRSVLAPLPLCYLSHWYATLLSSLRSLTCYDRRTTKSHAEWQYYTHLRRVLIHSPLYVYGINEHKVLFGRKKKKRVPPWLQNPATINYIALIANQTVVAIRRTCTYYLVYKVVMALRAVFQGWSN